MRSEHAAAAAGRRHAAPAMGVPARLTPLLGAGADGDPLAHLLELGPPHARLTLLLDAGWAPGAELSPDVATVSAAPPGASLARLLEALPAVDAVLLSHGGPRHAGALPLLAARGLLRGVPVYGTAPIAKMGAMAAYDAYLSAQARPAARAACARGASAGARVARARARAPGAPRARGPGAGAGARGAACSRRRPAQPPLPRRRRASLAGTTWTMWTRPSGG